MTLIKPDLQPRIWNVVVAFLLYAALSTVGAAQTNTKLDVGTVIPVRMSEPIDVDRSDISAATVLAHPITRVYRGAVAQDVRVDGRTAIPKGSNVELMVRVGRDNGLVLDLESVVVNGQRYGVRGEASRGEALQDHSSIGEIMPELTTGYVDAHGVKVDRDAVVTFRLRRALDVGVEDRGTDKDGSHYHGS